MIMGGATSKYEEAGDSWKASLSRSVSLPTSSNRKERENSTKVSWKSKLFSMPSSYRRKSDGIMSTLKPVKEEEDELDNGDLSEMHHCVGGLDSGRVLKRSITFQPTMEMQSQHRLSTPSESFNAGRISNERDDPGPLLNKHSSTELTDKTSGLRLLLSPSLPSESFTPSSRGGSFRKTLSMKGSFNSRPRSNGVTERAFPRVCMDNACVLEPEWMADVNALNDPADIPQFDPSILATFEKAVEDVAVGSGQNTFGSTFGKASNMEGTPAKNISVLSRLRSLKLSDKQGAPAINGHSLSRLKSLRSRSAREDRSSDIVPELTSFPFLNRKPSFSKVLFLKNDRRDWSSIDYLDNFIQMCPPGCERKVVLYFTSLRGVRKTFENCFRLRLILKGFGVHVDERDVWMHSKFRQELTDVMGRALSVPRLFILGRYIGGAEEVELLHEEGILAKLLEGLPRISGEVCSVCADVRFIPCPACSGSRKIISSHDIIERCPECNENGLIMCPNCD